jgi:hypothetical protein
MILAMVIDLSRSPDLITVLFEMLVQRVRIGDQGCHGITIIDIGMVGTIPGHQTCPGGHAYGLLAVSTIETHAFSRQSIDVRRYDVRVSVAAKFRAKVVHRNEQYIGARSSGSFSVRGRHEWQSKSAATNEFQKIAAIVMAHFFLHLHSMPINS